MSASRPYTFHNVLVIRSTDVGWHCEIEGQRVFVARLYVQRGTTVPNDGQRGPLTIAAFAVDEIRHAIRTRAGRP